VTKAKRQTSPRSAARSTPEYYVRSIKAQHAITLRRVKAIEDSLAASVEDQGSEDRPRDTLGAWFRRLIGLAPPEERRDAG
jgi:hypothetical protein